MATNAELVAALREAGHTEAADLVAKAGAQSTPVIGETLPGGEPPEQPVDPAAAAFAGQIRAAQEKNGWVSTSINAPIPDSGRF